MNRPITTLFMLTSVDGKISTGSNDKLDVDKDFPKIKGIKEGLKQYYEIEKTTDLHSLNSGRVLAKVGANKPQKNLTKLCTIADIRLVVSRSPKLVKTRFGDILQNRSPCY